MSWSNELITTVRVLINDLNTPSEFTDARIQQVLIVAAKHVQTDVRLENEYSINILNNTINPDPTSINDDVFLMLVSLKTACLIDQGTFRTKAALEGIRSSLGPASLWVQGNLAGYKTILDKGPCALYDQLSLEYNMGNTTTIRAVLSPFVGNNFDPRYLSNNNRHREFY